MSDEPGSPGSTGGVSACSPEPCGDSDGSWAKPSSIPLAESGPEILVSNLPRASSASGHFALNLELSHGQRMSYENFLASAISRGLAEDSTKLPWEPGI